MRWAGAGTVVPVTAVGTDPTKTGRGVRTVLPAASFVMSQTVKVGR